MIDFKKRLQEADQLEKRGRKHIPEPEIEPLFKQKPESLSRRKPESAPKQELEERIPEEEITEEELPRTGRKKRRIIIGFIIFLGIALVFAGRVLIASQNGTSLFPGFRLFNSISKIVPIAEKKLQGEENDRVNVLLLGIGGANHSGGNLTDTIILASLKPSSKQAALISVPRDLVAPVSNWKKINSVNAYAEQENPGSGGTATASAIGELLGQNIPYYVRVDFDGFERIIDEIGGVEINVEKSFDDYSYPIRGQEDNPDYYARYKHLHFDAGLQKMDGATALEYARSRHALGSEGSDFARARRQQLVLEAVKDKILSSQTLLNPTVVSKLIDEVKNDVSTNLDTWEMLRLWTLSKDIDRSQIINKVFSDAPDGLLVSARGEDGAYILEPKSGNFSDMREAAQDVFANASSTEATEQDTKKASVLSESATVYIANGTKTSGLAAKAAKDLKAYNFQVIGTGNAIDRNYQESVVYDLTGNAKSKSLEVLKNETGATQAFNSPSWLADYETGNKKSDFLLIVGADSSIK